MIRLALALVALAWPVHAESLRIAVTTSFQNSGLSDVLLPALREDTGINAQLVVVGTGQAIRLGEAGDVDALLVHARTAEEAFVASGHGTHRREVMYNDFVLVGPTDDPARVGDAASAAAALEAIAATKAAFASRGDNSGTHMRERTLWGAPPDGSWYRELGSGMGATLNTAVAMGAYTLSDRASWLNFGNKGDHAILFDGDPALFNQYAYLPVNPDRHPHVNASAARTVETWLVSDAAQTLIGGYMIDGQTLFTPNAKAHPE